MFTLEACEKLQQFHITAQFGIAINKFWKEGLIVLGLNNTLTLVSHFVSSPREKEKKREEIVEEMKERDREEKWEMKESEGTEEITIFPLYPDLLQGQQALPNCKPISVEHPGDKATK